METSSCSWIAFFAVADAGCAFFFMEVNKWLGLGQNDSTEIMFVFFVCFVFDHTMK